MSIIVVFLLTIAGNPVFDNLPDLGQIDVNLVQDANIVYPEEKSPPKITLRSILQVFMWVIVFIVIFAGAIYLKYIAYK